jgi:ectoine hydroxylase
MTSLTSDLKYKLQKSTIQSWAEKKGIVSAKGPRGSVLFFHGNVFHASSNNLSPWDRHAYLLTYNRVDNKLTESKNPRPDFLASRKAEPIEPVKFEFTV